MLYYFGYGSNMDITSIQAKGVYPLESHRAVLRGWNLKFNVEHYFRQEGGVANVEPTDRSDDVVQGVFHLCEDEDLVKLDAVEAFGVGYDRVEVNLETGGGERKAITYIGMDAFINNECLPNQRYLNILLKGARRAELDQAYIDAISRHPVHEKPKYPTFKPPSGKAENFTEKSLADRPTYTALAGSVFDMSRARWQHHHLLGFFGGRDMTLFHLKRMDTSDGSETLADLKENRLTAYQQEYLNEYLNEYNNEYHYVGNYQFD
jgi:hypothetical protein